ncbi:uncharacterized protein LOC122290157 [Carya illinoinensis]|uniref:uncharacterized protein LOC122290157 n=1 Tax=Carya illinoinensis TaxID=32201 RepID=UPI001C71B018|nr:uncharacterized protein LOC122290157 [Carya illinoinensis]
MSEKLESLELKKVDEMHVLPSIEKCNICEDTGYVTNACPTISAFKEVLLDQSNPVHMISKNFSKPYSNTYNAGWRSHPNFSWKNEQPGPSTQGQSQYTPYGAAGQGSGPSYFANQPLQCKKWSERFHSTANYYHTTIYAKSGTVNSQNAQSINDIRGTLTRVTTTLSNQEKGKFPAQTQPNPQVQSQSSQNNGEGANVKSVKSITTLRNGKVVGIPVHSARKSGNLKNLKTLKKSMRCNPYLLKSLC